MSSLVFVRHGQTDANRDGVLLGRLDPPLNATGVAQAEAVAERLAPLGVTRVLTSPLARCTESAAVIAARLRLDPMVDERLIEVDYGTYDGLRLADLPAELVQRWRTDPGFAPPGGESLDSVGERMAAFTAEALKACASGTVVAVSHVSPIKVAVLWALDLPAIYAWRLRLDNASITRLAPGPEGPVLLSFNER